MESQSIKSYVFLTVILVCIFVTNIILNLIRTDKSRTNTNTFLLKFNYIFPVLSFLSFRDQVDESYIWASKIQNFLLSGHLGVKLYDGAYGESSVSIVQPLISAFLKATLPLTFEQAMYLPGIISIYILIYYWSRAASIFGLSALAAIIPIAFLISSYGFLQNVSLSFDVPIALLALLIIYTESLKSNSPRMLTLVLVSLTPLIRIEFLALIFLWICAFVISTYKHQIKIPIFIRATSILLAPSIFTCLYKLWAFGDLVPAMVYFKVQNYNWISIVHIAAYYVRALGYIASTILIVFICMYIAKMRSKVILRKLSWFYTKLSPFHRANLAFIVFQFLTPILAGPDYHGDRLQRYIIIPLSLSVFIFFLHNHVSTKEITRATIARRKGLLLFLAFLISISVESNIYALKSRTWFDIQSRPSRAYCDQLIGPELRNFWSSRSDKPLVIATSEVNGISFSSEARLLDLAGGVDARHYPAKSDPISPGNLYGKFTFKDSIEKELPSILWPYKSESCTFYNKIDQYAGVQNLQILEQIYDSQWSRYWFPSLDTLSKLGYCPGKVEKNLENTKAVAFFLYYCQ